MEIIFTNTLNVVEDYSPKPASQVIPDWYRDMDSYHSENNLKKPDEKGGIPATIKRCMPVFDSMVAGYIIFSYVDVYVHQKKYENQEDGNTYPWYTWPSFVPIEFHPIVQAPTHPYKNGFPYPKWINPWSIKTPPGYSSLFMQPTHRESLFSILPGIVDTDTYISPVNFPFVLNDPSFEGLIPAGTPIAQVVPFKRDEWTMSIGDESVVKEHEKTVFKLRSKFFDSYKGQFRQLKTFK